MTSTDHCVQIGTWLYNGTVASRVEVWRRGVRPGTGDYEDDPEIRDDHVGKWYEVVYHSPGQSDAKPVAGGGFYRDLRSAIDSVTSATRNTVRWTDS